MTIAACYLSSEGVVLGADSTSTMYVRCPGPNPVEAEHHYDHAQKIFQIGEKSTLGITMWGLGNLAAVSYRTLIAQFSDSLAGQPPKTMSEVADRWNAFFWSGYSTQCGQVLQRVQELQGQVARSPDEEYDLAYLKHTFAGGFCLGGHLLHDRTPRAFEITYHPGLTSCGPVQELPVGGTRFWGCPNLINRLLTGIDLGIIGAIMQSGKWSGSIDDLYALCEPFFLGQPLDLPIRDAIDWVHAAIYTTIKAMRFSHLPPVCGGPVEIAVITADRPFRWVRHKRFDAAIAQDITYDAERV